MVFALGKWKTECQRCGFWYKNDRLKKEWTGLRVCSGPGTNECFEHRNTQDFVRGKADRQSPPWVRPKQPEIDVSPGSGNEVKPGDL